MEPVIGIDLGTTNSVVAWYDWATDRPNVVVNNRGRRTTPSVVSFADDGSALVGDPAKSRLLTHPNVTVFTSKRVIGRKISDLARADVAAWPFRVVDAGGGLPRFELSSATLVSPEEVAALILMELRAVAESALGTSVSKCVVTVPAYFNAAQRKATLDAGSIAGLDVLSILAEPTAAAIAYGLDERSTEGTAYRTKVAAGDGWHVLVFDLGGGTLDVSVLHLDGRGGFRQCAVGGDSHLGGEDFDLRLLEAVGERLEEEYAIQLTDSSRRRLRAECERVKRQLSVAQDAALDVAVQGIDIAYDVSREEFEGACSDLFDRCRHIVVETVQLARLEMDEIDEVVLVGGSARIPRVRALLSTLFRGKKLWDTISPDEAVALGAATYAAMQLVGRQEDGGGGGARSSSSAAGAAAASQPPSRLVPVTSRDGVMQQRSLSSGGPGTSGAAPPKVVVVRKVPVPSGAGQQPAVRALPSSASASFTTVPPRTRSTSPPPPPCAATTPAGVVASPTTAPLDFDDRRSASTLSATGRPPPPKRPATQPRFHHDPPAVLSPSKPNDSVVAPVTASNLRLVNVAPHTIGLVLAGGAIDPLIPRGTRLPVTKTDQYTTHRDGQRNVVIKVVEGEDAALTDATRSTPLSRFTFALPPAPAGTARLRVTFELSVEGLLRVDAVDEHSGERHGVEVNDATMPAEERHEAKQRLRGGRDAHHHGA